MTHDCAMVNKGRNTPRVPSCHCVICNVTEKPGNDSDTLAWLPGLTFAGVLTFPGLHALLQLLGLGLVRGAFGDCYMQVTGLVLYIHSAKQHRGNLLSEALFLFGTWETWSSNKNNVPCCWKVVEPGFNPRPSDTHHAPLPWCNWKEGNWVWTHAGPVLPPHLGNNYDNSTDIESPGIDVESNRGLGRSCKMALQPFPVTTETHRASLLEQRKRPPPTCWGKAGPLFTKVELLPQVQQTRKWCLKLQADLREIVG